jgi:hypothetical protein
MSPMHYLLLNKQDYSWILLKLHYGGGGGHGMNLVNLNSIPVHVCCTWWDGIPSQLYSVSRIISEIFDCRIPFN